MEDDSEPRRYLHELVDELNDQQIKPATAALEKIRGGVLVKALSEVSGLEMPEHWPPSYPDPEPLMVEGELASDQLIRERK